MARVKKAAATEIEMAVPFESTPGTWSICKAIDQEFTLDGDFAAIATNLNVAVDAVTWSMEDEIFNGLDCHRLSGTV